MQPEVVNDPPQLIASRLHLAVFLWLQMWMAATGGRRWLQWLMSAANLDAFHSRLTLMYVVMIGGELFFAWYVWFGIRKTGTSLRSLVGGQWTSFGSIAKDIGIALAFWLIWMVLLFIWGKVSGPHGESSNLVRAMVPRNETEIILWCALSISAGFSEEIAYRGYLQRQFLAMSNSMPVAVIGQGLLFGVIHLYQGVPAAIAIAISGVFLGWLAAWRQSLRPGMLVHAWYDACIGMLMYGYYLYYQGHATH